MKIIFSIILVLGVFKFCFIIDDELDTAGQDLIKVDVYSNVKQNVKKRNEILTVDKTNQKSLRKIHISKYNPEGRIIEPIGEINE